MAAKEIAPQLSAGDLRAFFPDVSRVSEWKANGTVTIFDKANRMLGFVLHTRQESQAVVGYVGSTELAIVFGQGENESQAIRGILILESEDTEEHVQAIREDANFLSAWNGLEWNEATNVEVDAVSGATLTSYAIVESLRRRLGSDAPSFKFPNEVSIDELKRHFPDALRFSTNNEHPLLIDVYAKSKNDRIERLVGSFLRSSPTAENINGYQGPSDFLVLFDEQGLFKKILIRSSFDNTEPEPFVDYVRDDEYFTEDMFAGLSRRQLAEFDDDEFEGVSGATMTSDGLYRAMKLLAVNSLQSTVVESRPAEESWVFSVRDFGTLAVLCIAVLFTFTRVSRFKRLRTFFQVLLIVYFGFLNGDLISQVLLMGWSQNGVQFRHGLGILVLTLAAFCIPLFTKRNIYCHQICPFGAAQQIARKTAKPRQRLPRVLHSVMRLIPGLLLVLIVIATVQHWNWNLASFEPFDAFSFRIAGLSTVLIAIVGMTASFRYPMAYCKYGCPTGFAIEFIRSSSNNKVGIRDFIAIGLFSFAIFTLQF